MIMGMLKLILIVGLVSIECKGDSIDDVKNSRNFTGKVVLVTGSSSGIGKETTKLFSGLGAQVVVTGRKAADVSTAAKEIQEVSPKKLKPLEIVADLTNATQLDDLYDQTIKHFGRLDILVNNAGYLGTGGIESDIFLNQLDINFKIDVLAHLKLIQKAIPALTKTKGNIVSISSDLVSTPQQLLLPYSISKQSLEMTTKVLAQELGPKGIRINAIRAGYIDKHLYPKNITDGVVSTTPLRRVGNVEDIAKGVVILASSDAEFITGAILDIDGGWALGMGGGLFRKLIEGSGVDHY